LKKLSPKKYEQETICAIFKNSTVKPLFSEKLAFVAGAFCNLAALKF
jgi:hypothetical protein